MTDLQHPPRSIAESDRPRHSMGLVAFAAGLGGGLAGVLLYLVLGPMIFAPVGTGIAVGFMMGRAGASGPWASAVCAAITLASMVAGHAAFVSSSLAIERPGFVALVPTPTALFESYDLAFSFLAVLFGVSAAIGQMRHTRPE
ncbi:MAG: hypothetical protein AAFP22_02505 [Planctomycetota bacterium]